MRGFRKSGVLILLTAASILLCACSNWKKPELPSVPTLPPVTAAPTGKSEGKATPAPESQEIRFADINFENAVRDVIGKKIGAITVSDVSHLRSFSARVCGITDIREIAYFSELEYLDLKGNRITDLSPLAGLQQLKYLDLSKNFTVLSGEQAKGLNLAPLQNLTFLETLNLNGNLITDVTPLAALHLLKNLDLQSNRLTDISALATCIKLETLNLSYNYGINSETGDEQGIRELSCVSSMTELRVLNVQNNIVMTLDGVENLEHLTELNVSGNYLLSLEPLETCTHLTTLSAEQNNLMDLKPLSGHPTLSYLDVRNNWIHEVPEILKMPSLRIFYYEGNQILNYKPIDRFEARLREETT